MSGLNCYEKNRQKESLQTLTSFIFHMGKSKIYIRQAILDFCKEIQEVKT